MQVELYAGRKWDSRASKERLRRAIFLAMRKSRSTPIGATAVSRFARRSKSLIYLHFGSVEGLIADVIGSRLVFPPVEKLLSGVEPESGFDAAMALVSARLSEEFRLRPETMDLIGWSLGNADPMAVGVIAELLRYCETIADKMTGETGSASLFLGPIMSVLCNRQIAGDARE